ncbi:phospholipase C [Pectinatus frisingensis]|uniref:phospholipase C n=1 Tax=Pectinatus frisingensis TaxID=865 RepID=UPI0018C71FC7|nr:alkaline phosphatase family protein [Pectinatus frisingensis]
MLIKKSKKSNLFTQFFLLSSLIAAGSVSIQPPVLAAPRNITPIKYVVVIFDENESFDHYFGTYPFAENTSNEPLFFASPDTPAINGLTPALLTHNPNQANPKRFSRSQAHTQDFDHGYTAEQKSFNGGLMDKFIQYDGHGNADVMNYYDGNTVTALWNLAQHFTMNDNYFGANLGPSTPGAINVISGNNHGATVYSANKAQNGVEISPDDKNFPQKAVTKTGTLYGDIDPYYDYASKKETVSMSGTNIGDLLNKKDLTWGCFFGGYDDPTATHKNIAGENIVDYIPHHEPFQYYDPTSNLQHERPTSVAMIGHTDRANHQYDMTDFWAAAKSGNLPNYSFLKAPAYQDGHPSYSDPIGEQRWLAETINKLESLPTWKNTAIFVTYDDSDGWYDHVMPPIINHSQDPDIDTVNAGTNSPLNNYQGRLGYGPRMPMLLISPYAKHNTVIHTIADQSSVLRFVEDNWNLGRIGNGSFDTFASSLDDMFDFSPDYYNPPVYLDPDSGEPVAQNQPFKKGNQIYMTLQDLTQSLDTVPHHDKDNTWFIYNNHLISVSNKENEIKVDEQLITKDSPIISKNNIQWLPITDLSKTLGIKPIEYKPNEILFKQISPVKSSNTAVIKNETIIPTTAAHKSIVLEANNEKSALSVSEPFNVPTPADNNTLINQIINGAQTGKTYSLKITAPEMKNTTVYVSFINGTVDTKGTLTAGNTAIHSDPVAISLDNSGEANLNYTVDTAPTNWDAYDNDNIIITNSPSKAAATYKNEISVFS